MKMLVASGQVKSKLKVPEAPKEKVRVRSKDTTLLMALDEFMRKNLPGKAYDVLKISALFLLGRLSYCRDGLATQANCDFINDARFSQSYELGKATGSWGDAEPAWRAYVLCWAATRAATLARDFVECGVNKGGFSRCVMNYVGFEKLPKTFWLLDTFAGLSDQHLSEAEKAPGSVMDRYRGHYDDDYFETVKKIFNDFANVEIVKGMVPETLELVKTERVAYLSIDMNCVQPEIAAAEFFWDKLTPGATVVLDDYGWPAHIEQKRAFDVFAGKKGVPILSLPTGQGVIMKP